MSERVTEINDSSLEREVLQSKQPVLVDFWAAWCGPCRMLTPTIEAIAEQYSENAAVVKLNVDDNPSTTEAYGIRSIPTLILFSGGKEVERLIGTTSKESISGMIEKYIVLTKNQSQIAQRRAPKNNVVTQTPGRTKKVTTISPQFEEPAVTVKFM